MILIPTAFDFDNSLFGWYIYDLAELWCAGTGWAMFERNACKRREIMDNYFNTVLEGYKSETDIDDSMLAKLPLFINAHCMECVLGMFTENREDCEDFGQTTKRWSILQSVLRKIFRTKVFLMKFIHAIILLSMP